MGGLASLSGGAAAGVGAGEVAGDEGPVHVLGEAELGDAGVPMALGAAEVDQPPVGAEAQARRLPSIGHQRGEERADGRVVGAFVLPSQVADGRSTNVEVGVVVGQLSEYGGREKFGVTVMGEEQGEAAGAHIRVRQPYPDGVGPTSEVGNHCLPGGGLQLTPPLPPLPLTFLIVRLKKLLPRAVQ